MARFFLLFLVVSSLFAEEDHSPSAVDYSFGQPSAEEKSISHTIFLAVCKLSNPTI